jgi:hypothetical protein
MGYLDPPETLPRFRYANLATDLASARLEDIRRSSDLVDTVNST